MCELPNLAPGENWADTFLVGPESAPRVRKQRGKRRPTVVELLDRAEAVKRAMDAEGVNRAEMARRLGVSRARITQLLDLLTLAPGVLAEVRQLVANGKPVHERTLRPLVGRPYTLQLRALRAWRGR